MLLAGAQIREISEGLHQNREYKAYAASISSRDTMAAGTATDKGSEASLKAVLGVTDKDPLVIVAVVGRQYVAEIQRLWTDKNSSLWRSSVSLMVHTQSCPTCQTHPVGGCYLECASAKVSQVGGKCGKV